MTELLDVFHTLGAWSVGALWIPVLAWTLLAAPLYVLMQRSTDGHPLVRYRLLQALLISLPAGIAAAAWIDASGLLTGWTTLSSTPAGGDIALLLPMESSNASAATATAPLTGYHLVGFFTGLAAIGAVIYLGRLIRNGWAIAQLRVHGSSQSATSTQETARTLAADVGIARPVQVRLTNEAVVPLTYGTLRPIILLPRSLTDRPDALQMTLTHELVHIRRFDFAARWAEKLTAAVFAVHPGVAKLVQAIETAREMACDAEALRLLRCSRKGYADLLFSFSSLATPRPACAVSIAETSSSLKERIHAMTRFDPSNHNTPRYTSLLAASLVVTLGLAVVACSDAVTPPSADNTAPETAATQSESLDDSKVFIVVEDRPTLKGGMQALQEAITYPELAKEAGIEGRVFVQFVVDENGDVVNPHVTRGVHEALDRAALDAVKGLSFEPGRQRGEAVKVQMALPVTFKLGGDASNEDESTPIFEKAGMQELSIEIRSDDTMLVDGRVTDIGDLVDVVKRKLASTDAKTYAALTVDSDVAMETVDRVKASLRAAGANRVSYTSK